MLWEIFRNIIIENDVIINEINIIISIVVLLNKIILDIMKISLIVLMVGGAEMLIAIKINHQKVMLEDMLMRPLKDKMFREWYFI